MVEFPTLPEPRCQLVKLVELFFPNVASLGEFVEVDVESAPDRPRYLLAHNRHMTTTLEAFHQSRVDVEVLASATEGDFYCRQILLRKTSDQRVVQFAIVRLDFQCVDAAIRREIEQQGAPLGRILIDHNVVRNVVMLSLWRIEPTLELQQRLDMSAVSTIYGRTAMIYCNGEPAIELLEIPTPA